MKLIFNFVIFLSFFNIPFSHSQNLLWAKQFSGSENEGGRSITVGISGNVYSIGFFEDSVDFDPGPNFFYLNAPLFSDMYISKLDELGNFVWANSLGSASGGFEGSSIITDNNENLYITGMFSGTQDFDPGPNSFFMSASPYNAFILKLDMAGNFIWAKKINSGDFGWGFSVSVDNNYNVYTTGRFQGNSDFDPGSGIFNLTSNGFYDIFISKLDSSGNLIWVKQIGGPEDEEGYSIRIDQFGSVIISGVFQGTVDFDPGIGTFNLSTFNSFTHDAFISKYDSSGSLLWAKQSQGIGTHNVVPKSMALDNQSNIYLTGYFSGVNSVDFDPGPNSLFLSSSGTNQSEIYIWKLDTSGNVCWAKSLDGNCYNLANSIAIDNLNYIHTTGRFCGTIDFDPDSAVSNLATNYGNSDAFISILDSSGQFISANVFSGDSAINSNAIAIDAYGNNYVTGDFKWTTNFGTNINNFFMTPYAESDVFIAKNGIISSLIENQIINDEIALYPNPSNGIFHINCTTKILRLKVLNSLGITLYESDNYYSNSSIIIRETGIHLVEIQTENRHVTMKLLLIE